VGFLFAPIERYHQAGIRDISHDFCPGRRHEMLHEINRGEVLARLLGWISTVLGRTRASAGA
jgi:hypothetical protein